MVQPLLLPLFLRIIYSILCNYMKWINDINDIGHSNNINDINSNHTVFHQLCLLRTVCVHVSQTLSLSLSLKSCEDGANLVVGEEANEVLEHNFGIFCYHRAQLFTTTSCTHTRAYTRAQMVREFCRFAKMARTCLDSVMVTYAQHLTRSRSIQQAHASRQHLTLTHGVQGKGEKCIVRGWRLPWSR